MGKIRIFGLDAGRVGKLLSVADEDKASQPPTPDAGVSPAVPGRDAPDAKADAAVPSEGLAEQPGGWIGRYKLLQVLGEGGMGIVYLAEQELPIRRQVALKVIKPGMDSKRVLARFETEQQALALMDHPHIARVHDAGLTERGRPYFVMEHIRGVPITNHCDQQRLTIVDRLRLFLHVCAAIQHAHQKGVIHRDLKPSNILVEVQNEEMIPKVIDFGVARAISQPLTERTLYTEQGLLIGTPEYMSPEQADIGNQDIDTRTDIYSLGIVLYELLAGVLPFNPKTFRTGGIDQIRKVICGQEPKTPSTRLSKTSPEESIECARRRRTDPRALRRTLRGDLDWITLKALEKDRTRRYATVDALAADIRSYLNHQPVSAAPPRILYRAGKLARRHRLATVVTGVILIMLTIGGWMLRTYVQVAKEHLRFQAFEHEQRLTQAENALGARNWKEALAQADSLIASPHVGRRARLVYAQALLGQEEPVRAIAELRRLLTASDDTAGQAHFLLADLYHQGDPCSPGESEEYIRLWQEHSTEAKRLIAGTPQYYLLQARAEPDVRKKLRLLAQALAVGEEKHYDSLRERAYLYLAQQDYVLTRRDALWMTRVQPKNPQGYLLSAIALRELGRFDEALAEHAESLRLAPDDLPCHYARWETYMRLGQYNPALSDIRRCVQLHGGGDVEGVDYSAKLISTLIALGRYAEADQEYDRFAHLPELNRGLSIHVIGSLGRLLLGATTLKVGFDILASGRPCHPPEAPLRGPASTGTGVAERFYSRLSRNAGRLVVKGFTPSWSPDGTKLAYSLGMSATSGVAILDLATRRTELLVMPGSDPAWSPDGRRIAFVKARHVLPVSTLTGRDIQTFGLGQDPENTVQEVWVMNLAEPRTLRRVAEGGWAHWGQTSGRLYYTSRRDRTLYSTTLAETGEAPQPVLPNCSDCPVVSPDERWVADYRYRELRIVDVASREIVQTWVTPPQPRAGLSVAWSPDSREISVGGEPGSEMGLWIYDRQTTQARQVLSMYIVNARWSPSGTPPRLAFGLCLPLMEIWIADLKPGGSTVESFDPVYGENEHCLDLIGLCAWLRTLDPDFTNLPYIQADCALWMGHKQADKYLHNLDAAMTPATYDTAGCIEMCRAILNGPPELRARLGPLALLFARKALAKDPNNPDSAKILKAAENSAGRPAL